jgi:sirohydrochlorin ferrochelatase
MLNKPLRRHCLLVAHGSRLESSNEEIRDLAALLREMSQELTNIDCAFLEIAKPTIEQGLRRCIALGADEIVVVPYFLSSGRHVTFDIPEQIASVKKHFPEIAICVIEPIGANKNMASFLLAHMLGNAFSD